MDKLIKIISDPPKKERMLGDNFRVIILGSSGSGKSFLCCRMLLSEKPFYNKYFRKIFYVNSTLKESQMNNPYNIIDIPEENIYEEMNDSTLSEILDNLPKGKDGKIRPWLLCIDDSGQLDRNSEFAKRLFIKIRHFNGSVILCVQSLKMVPPTVRKSITHLILMNATNKKMVEDIAEEFMGVDKNQGIKVIEEIFNDTSSDERPFMFLNAKNSKVHNRFPNLVDV